MCHVYIRQSAAVFGQLFGGVQQSGWGAAGTTGFQRDFIVFFFRGVVGFEPYHWDMMVDLFFVCFSFISCVWFVEGDLRSHGNLYQHLSTNWDPGDSWWSWNLSIQVGIGRIGDFHAAAPGSHHGRDVWICMVEMIEVMRTRRMMMVGKWWWWWLWLCLRISVETAHHKKTQMPLNPRTWKSGRKLPQIDLLWSRKLGFETAASQLSRASLNLQIEYPQMMLRTTQFPFSSLEKSAPFKLRKLMLDLRDPKHLP